METWSTVAQWLQDGADVEGSHDTAVIPTINTWYRFNVEVEAVGQDTAIRVKVWQDGSTEPTSWQIDATDSSSPLTSGTFGLWAYNNGSKYWDDLTVESINGAPAATAVPTETPTPTPDVTETPTPLPTATSTPIPTDPPAAPVVIQRVTYAIAGQPIAMRVSGDPVAANKGLHTLYSDHLGSNSAMQAPDGSITRTRYEPFGAYRGGSGGNAITDRGFTGHKQNDSLGLIYMNARFYVPTLNRFASADTIVPDFSNPQSLNRYTYVLNSPNNLIDPTRLYPFQVV